jgi:hypothetical protein
MPRGITRTTNREQIMTENNAIVVATNNSQLATSADLMPAMSIEMAITRYNTVVEYTKRVLKKGRDYGTIPGTERKSDDGTPSNASDTLLKPGAEKLCTLFGLTPDFVDYRVIEDWDRGLFYYAYKCTLSRNGHLIASGIGSCNSREKKYRRSARLCPDCGAATIKRSKYPPKNDPNAKAGWYCHEKAGGCGRQFDADDPAITEQALRDDPSAACDLINTVQKMAQKRAMVAATLIATNASEFFTQDVEDMGMIDVEAVDTETGEVLPPASKPAPARKGKPVASRQVQPPPQQEDQTNWMDDEAYFDLFIEECQKRLTPEQSHGLVLHLEKLAGKKDPRGRKPMAEWSLEGRQSVITAIRSGLYDNYKPADAKTEGPAKSPPADTLPAGCTKDQILAIAAAHAPAGVEPDDAKEQFEAWMRLNTAKPWHRLSDDEKGRAFEAIKSGKCWLTETPTPAAT